MTPRALALILLGLFLYDVAESMPVRDIVPKEKEPPAVSKWLRG
jgi:hypothetical protein